MKINRLTPNFKVSDIRKTIEFYQSGLGFTLLMAVPKNSNQITETLNGEDEYIYASMEKDGVEFMFEAGETFLNGIDIDKPSFTGASVSFYMEMEDVQEYHASLLAKNIQTTELTTTWYGMSEFYLQDINGYILGFAEQKK